MSSKGLLVSSFGLTLLRIVAPSVAQQDSSEPSDPRTAEQKTTAEQTTTDPKKRETVANPLTEKQRKAFRQ
jgi:hypothetical protein